MSEPEMTSQERVLKTISFEEPDRVPYFLLLSLHGAKELGLTIREYFSRASNIVEGQRRLHARYGHDCLYGFFHASLEVEAFGGETLFFDDGPPNAGFPPLKIADLESLEPPNPEEHEGLRRVLRAIEGLVEVGRGGVPIVGVAVAPYSLPTMQMGFEAYLDLIYQRTDLLERLLAVNEEFCVAWANAQLAAGATVICYFNPFCSPTIIPPDVAAVGFASSKRTIARINGPTATHFASGIALPVLDQIAETGTAIVGVSCQDDLVELTRESRQRLTVLGNLDGVSMSRWTIDEAEREVRAAIEAAAPGGGFILSDNHGEIPWDVPDEVIETIAESVRTYGRYPIEGAE